MECLMDLFINIVLAIYILLVGKCCFEESFVLDKKSIVVSLVTAVVHSLALYLFGENSIPYSVIDVFSVLVLGWTILRGGKGIVRRIAAFLQILFFLIMPIFVIADILTMQFGPSMMWDEQMDNIVMAIAVCLYFIEAVYVYWVLYRKQICIRFQVAEKIGENDIGILPVFEEAMKTKK